MRTALKAICGLLIFCAHGYANTKATATWGVPDTGRGEEEMLALAVGPFGDVYVGEKTFSTDARVQQFSMHGVLQRIFAPLGSADGQVRNPTGIATDRHDGTVYVIDANESRVQKFGHNGGFLRKWGSRGEGKGQFMGPSAVAVGPDGSVYVLESTNRIQKFSPHGEFLTSWIPSPVPYAIAVGPDGTVYVTHQKNHISRYSANGVLLGTFPTHHDGYSLSIAVSSLGLVLVTYFGTDHIFAYDPEGNLLHKFLVRRKGGAGLNPQFISYYHDNIFFVLDRGRHVSKFHAQF